MLEFLEELSECRSRTIPDTPSNSFISTALHSHQPHNLRSFFYKMCHISSNETSFMEASISGSLSAVRFISFITDTELIFSSLAIKHNLQGIKYYFCNMKIQITLYYPDCQSKKIEKTTEKCPKSKTFFVENTSVTLYLCFQNLYPIPRLTVWFFMDMISFSALNLLINPA